MAFGSAMPSSPRLGEGGAVRHHLLELLLAHRAAQQVGAAQRVAADDLGHLHHLLLVDHDPVGLLEHPAHQRMRVLDLPRGRACARRRWGSGPSGPGGTAPPARSRPRTRWLGVAQHALHADDSSWNTDRLALAHQPVRGLCRPAAASRRSKGPRGARADEVLHREPRGWSAWQAQEVELHQADRLDVVLVVLADRGITAVAAGRAGRSR